MSVWQLKTSTDLISYWWIQHIQSKQQDAIFKVWSLKRCLHRISQPGIILTFYLCYYDSYSTRIARKKKNSTEKVRVTVKRTWHDLKRGTPVQYVHVYIILILLLTVSDSCIRYIEWNSLATILATTVHICFKIILCWEH